jgi:serine/threonine-protein kinase RsbW
MTYSLRMEAQLENLSAIRDFVEEMATRLHAAPTAIPNVVLAVDEMVTNIIVHGYQGRPGSIEIEVTTQDDALIICLRDQAPPFDPTTMPPPDLSIPFDDRPPGGLGIYLTRKVMDEVQHRVTATHGNDLTLIKQHIIQSASGGTP